jgi:hypothetical protein
LSVNELQRQTVYQKARICQAQSRKCGEIFFLQKHKEKLATRSAFVLLFPRHQPLATMKEVPTPSVKITAAIARNKVAEQIVKDAAKPKGPTLAQFALKPRPLMRGGRDVS